jgi:acetate kinase
VDRLGTPDAVLTVGTDPRPRPVGTGLVDAVAALASWLTEHGIRPAAIAHRIVHGGPDHHDPTWVDEALLSDLRAAVPLAPLHVPQDLAAITAARLAWPDADQVACFDTGFHANLPPWSRRLPVPEELVAAGVRRYGFHGLSIQSVLHARPDLGGAVIAHLGSGCSISAVTADGRPRHTTMSLTPTGGMLSGTRSGDLDPEILLYLIEGAGYSVPRLRELLDRRSGLAGIAGGSHDVRDLLASPDPRAALALEVFVHGAAAAIVGCASTLDRWDSLVFTGGIGEHCPQIRDRISRRLLAVRGGGPGNAIDDPGGWLAAGGLRVLVVPADEEGVLDRAARQLLAARVAVTSDATGGAQ